MFDIARAIEAAGLGPAEDFLKVAQSDTSLIADIAPNARSLEGYLFPDTYEFSRMRPCRRWRQPWSASSSSGRQQSALALGIVRMTVQARDARHSSITPEH